MVRAGEKLALLFGSHSSLTNLQSRVKSVSDVKMAMTNAERQARYLQKLKARADGAGLEKMAQEAVDAGFAAMWAIFSRPNADGGRWGDIDGMSDVADLKRSYRGQAVEALAALEDWLRPEEETLILDGERDAIKRAAAIYRVALLRHVTTKTGPVKKTPKR